MWWVSTRVLKRIFFLSFLPPRLTILRSLSVQVKENFFLNPNLYDHNPDNKTHWPNCGRMRILHAISDPCIQVCWTYQSPASEESEPTKYSDSLGWQTWKEVRRRFLLISGTEGWSVVTKCKVKTKLCFLLKFFMKKQNLHWGCFANISKIWHLKMHPLGWLSVFGLTKFLLLRGKHKGIFVTSTIELQQKVLVLI